jgi:hypothetical protein
MNALAFILLSLVFMYIGRKIGWVLSRAVLYPGRWGVAMVLCLLWGINVAFFIWILIAWRHPNIVVKIVFGFLLGAYVAIPNYGLVAEFTIPSDAKPRHNMISTLPLCAYIVALVGVYCIAWLHHRVA